MKTLRSIPLLLLLALMSGAAFGRGSVPIVNYEDIPIPTSGETAPTLEGIEQAIRSAGARQGYPWTVTESEPGRLQLSTLVRGKHTVVIEVAYNRPAYSIRYVSSINMNYRKRGGNEIIHPNYNVWVLDLKADIDGNLLRMPQSLKEAAPHKDPG